MYILEIIVCITSDQEKNLDSAVLHIESLCKVFQSSLSLNPGQVWSDIHQEEIPLTTLTITREIQIFGFAYNLLKIFEAEFEIVKLGPVQSVVVFKLSLLEVR